MTLSDFASIGSLVSGVAVLISLVYLGLQVKQNTKHTRALIFQGSAEMALTQFRAVADFAEATVIGNGGIATPEEIRRVQFLQVCRLYSVVWDNFFAQHEEGLVNEEHFRRIRWAMVQQLRANPGVRENIRQMLLFPDAPDHRFHAFLKELVAESAPPPANPAVSRPAVAGHDK